MNGHPIAVWSGVASFFATLLAVGTINILNSGDNIRLLSSVVVGIITAGAVYAKERLNDAKNRAEGRYAGDIVVTETDGAKQYSLELGSDPNEIDTKTEVTFKVVKRKP